MSAPLLLGIEIGGTKLQLGLGHGDGRVLALERRAVEPDGDAVRIWETIISALDPLLARVGACRDDLRAVGIGFGGPVDPGRGIVVRSHQVEGWSGFPLADGHSARPGGVPGRHRERRRCRGAGEARYGAGTGRSPLLYVNSGSGVGGGLIVDGQIYRGSSGFGALEIGHLRVFPEARDRLDARGLSFGTDTRHTFRTLEDAASGWAIGRAGANYVAGRPPVEGAESPLISLSEGDPSRVSARVVADAAKAGDRVAQRILNDATTAMAQALAHAVTLLAPRRIVLGGGVSLLDDELWRGPIRSKLAERVFEPFQDTYDVLTATLGEAVVVQGGLARAHDATLPGTRPSPSPCIRRPRARE